MDRLGDDQVDGNRLQSKAAGRLGGAAAKQGDREGQKKGIKKSRTDEHAVRTHRTHGFYRLNTCFMVIINEIIVSPSLHHGLPRCQPQSEAPGSSANRSDGGRRIPEIAHNGLRKDVDTDVQDVLVDIEIGRMQRVGNVQSCVGTTQPDNACRAMLGIKSKIFRPHDGRHVADVVGTEHVPGGFEDKGGCVRVGH